jgi:hypothetical protein
MGTSPSGSASTGSTTQCTGLTGATLEQCLKDQQSATGAGASTPGASTPGGSPGYGSSTGSGTTK